MNTDNVVPNIFRLLQEKGTRQRDLADYLGINESTIANWKNGKSKSWQKYLSEISNFFGIEIADLLNCSGQVNEQRIDRIDGNSNFVCNYFKSPAYDGMRFYRNANNEVMVESMDIDSCSPLPAQIQTVYDKLSERSKLQVQMFILDQAEKEENN